MKKSATLFWTILVMIIFTSGCSWTDFNDDAALSRDLKIMLDDLWTDYGQNWPDWSGGVALKITTDKDSYFVTSGLDRQVDSKTHFRSASTTKTFTAAAVMRLFQEGRLDIDDAITDLIPNTDRPYVPDNADYDLPYKNQITIRLLLSHRAGVFDVSNSPIPENVDAPYAGQYYITYIREVLGRDDHTFTFDELVGTAARHQLSYNPPDTEFHYSNTGYSILGKIIERVTGLTYAQYIQDSFLTPNRLTMTSLPFLGTDIGLPEPYTPGYLYYENRIYETTNDNMSPHVAEGNLITTPDNLSRWIKLLITARAGVSRQQVDRMMEVRPTNESHDNYGLGLTFTPGLGYGHNGGHIGYLTVMRYDPEYDVTIVIYANVLNAHDLVGQSETMYDIGRQARRILGYPADAE